MFRFHVIFSTASLGLAASAMGSIITVYPVNDGFETPNLGGGYGYANQSPGLNTGAAGFGWTFTGLGSAIAATGSPFGVSAAANVNNNPGGGDVHSNGASTDDGKGQAAVLQLGDGTVAKGGISQSITLPAFTTSATLTFSDEKRGGQTNGVVVYVDGNLVSGGGTIAAPLTALSGGSFGAVSIPLVIGPGSHTFAFAGDNYTGGSDESIFIDSVSVSAVTPEPASLGLLGLAGLGLTARRRRA